MKTGYLQDATTTDGEHRRHALAMGADLCRLFGLDPARYSDAYLRGAAMSAVTLLGRYFAFTVDPADTPADQSDVRLFQEAMRGT